MTGRKTPAQHGSPAAGASWPSGIWPPVLVAAALILASRLAFFLSLPLASEDAYITFRYARHLALGHGLEYNLGEKVMGFTSPLWTLWCALGAVFRFDLVVWTRVTAIVVDLAVVWMSTDLLARRFSNRAAWAFSLFYATWPLYSAASASGLETNVLFFLMLAITIAIERGGWWSGALLGLLGCYRPEGVLAALVMGLAAPWRARLTALAVVAAGWGGLAAYFGTVLPQSVVAKASIYGMPGFWEGRHWWDWLVPFPMGRWPFSSEGIHLGPLVLVLLASALYGARELWRQRSHPSLHLASAGAAILLAYAVTGTAYFWWYLVGPLTCVTMMAAIGLPKLTPGRLLPALALVATAGSWFLAFPLYLGRAGAELVNNASATSVLTRFSSPGDLVMAEPIGLIGYETDLPMLDEVGLVAPKVVARRLSGAGWYADLVAEHRPRWLVVRSEMLETEQGYAGAGAPFRTAAERAGVFAHYEVVWPTQPLDGVVLRVLRRRSMPQ